MNSSQRWISIAAFGAVCWALASTVNLWFDRRGTDGGWFNYAPNNDVSFIPDTSFLWRRLAVWLVAIAVWAVVSIRVARDSD